MSLLEDLRSRQKSDKTLMYQQVVDECPPISKALLVYLEKLFARKTIHHLEPMMQQALVFQAGIDKVINHLRSRNEAQEKEIKSTRTK